MPDRRSRRSKLTLHHVGSTQLTTPSAAHRPTERAEKSR